MKDEIKSAFEATKVVLEAIGVLVKDLYAYRHCHHPHLEFFQEKINSFSCSSSNI
jgi:hypothetical protein